LDTPEFGGLSLYMHESDAMDFIDIVLAGFIERCYQELLDEDDEFELFLKDIRAFITDNNSYWVKEKAYNIIDAIQWAEGQFKAGKYIPDTPKKAVKAIISSTQKNLKDKISIKRSKIMMVRSGEV
jgi:predicted AAA+ superfamily ATPase